MVLTPPAEANVKRLHPRLAADEAVQVVTPAVEDAARGRSFPDASSLRSRTAHNLYIPV